MTPEERAGEFMASLQVADAIRPRSIQSHEGVIGGSDIGWCAEQLRLKIVQAPRSNSPDSFAAMAGTWMHAGAFEYREEVRPELLHEQRLVAELPNGAKVPVTVDEIDPDEPSVGDLKTKDRLADIRKGRSTTQQRWQRHLSGLAAIQAGLVPEQGLIVWNLWLDRSGHDKKPFVEQELFSRAVIAEITSYLDDVLYAVRNNEEAAKEQPRHKCAQWCEFYTLCRGDEIESGPISNPILAELVDMYAQASEDRRTAEEVMDALRADVENVTGRTSKSQITSTRVNKGKGYTSITAKLL